MKKNIFKFIKFIPIILLIATTTFAVQYPQVQNRNEIFTYKTYQILLERTPDTGGFNFHVNLLNSGARSQQQIFEAFQYSYESQILNQNNYKYVSILYQNLLFRDGTMQEISIWTAYLNTYSKTRWEVYLGFIHSEEYKTKMIRFWLGMDDFFLTLNNVYTTPSGTAGSPVLNLQGGGAHREVCPINRPDITTDTIFLYHRCVIDNVIGIGLSISYDGGNSYPDFRGRIISPSFTGGFAVAPSVIKKDNTWYMVWEEGVVSSIYWATSTNGITWTNRGHLPLYGSTNGFDTQNQGTPGLFLDEDGMIYVFYYGMRSGENKGEIGFAKGISIYNLVKNYYPVISNSINTWDSHVSMPRIIKEEGYYYMVYEGASNSYLISSDNLWGVGIARSTNLINWEKCSINPLIPDYIPIISLGGNNIPNIFRQLNGDIFIFSSSADAQHVKRYLLR